jgi:hypothetical protein
VFVQLRPGLFDVGTVGCPAACRAKPLLRTGIPNDVFVLPMAPLSDGCFSRKEVWNHHDERLAFSIEPGAVVAKRHTTNFRNFPPGFPTLES